MIYLDNAATSFPKPQKVYKEVARCIEEYCGNPGRSGHYMSQKAAQTVYGCRNALAKLFSLDEVENVVFTLNTTYALNMIIKGLLTPKDHVIISNIEHNSVYRPIVDCGTEYDIFNSFQSASAIMHEIETKLRPNTKLIICSHASNICGLRNPIYSIGELCNRKGIYFAVDAAQSAGVYKINMKECHIDALCVPGHKGLYGIQGCGALLLSSNFKGEKAKKISAFVQGGNGVDSLKSEMPYILPERLEAGTLPTPAIAGLKAGIEAIEDAGTEHIREHEYALYHRVRERLCNHKRIRVYLRDITKGNIILFNIRDVSSITAAYELDKYGVCVRGGFHCSPLAHKYLNTGENGAVRVSFGAFNTLEEADRFCDILNKLTTQL